ncbi:MAG: hypothetical protein WCO54_08080 [Bacteroidota bacterium]
MVSKKVLFLLCCIFQGLMLLAQAGFQQQSTNVGRLTMTFSNAGTVGNPKIAANTQGSPSMAFPQKGKEHLFESGIWIGAIVNGQPFVSTSAFDAASGYSTGASGYEFTPLAYPVQRSSLTSSANYSSSAISHQDIILDFFDDSTIVPGTSIPIGGHTNPLGAHVHLETYSWNYPFADFFTICEYTITNKSKNRWDSVWLGQWADLVVRNVNVTHQTGTNFYNKGRNGVDNTYKSIYAYLSDMNADDINYISSYGAMQFLGINWRGMFFNPDKPDTFVNRSFPKPSVNYNFWNFTATSPDYNKPSNDLERYIRMHTNIDSLTLNNTNGPINGAPNNWIQLLSSGPLVSIDTNESFTYVMAYVAANVTGTAPTANGGYVASQTSRTELTEHLMRARATYFGEDVNGDGKYRAELDLNNNGKLDHYVLPTPPDAPKVKIISTDSKIELYWDAGSIASVDPISRRKDFEGYRVYRTNIGDDLSQSLSNNENLIAQWDSVGNNIGYNNGFDLVRLSSPKYFEGDTIPYWFKYEMSNLQNGWQYLFVVTAFDQGDQKLGIGPLESSFTQNATSVFAGTAPEAIESNSSSHIGVYPNPYKTSASWDGSTSRTHKIYFYNLPEKCDIHIYTCSGDLVATLNHDATTYKGEDSKWFEQYATNTNKVFSGGEHAWDILSSFKTTVTTGIYLFTVKDNKTGNIEVGKFAIIK